MQIGAAIVNGTESSSAAGAGEGGHPASAAALARFFFILGQVALQSLFHIDLIVSSIRKKRLAAESNAGQSAHGTTSKTLSIHREIL